MVIEEIRIRNFKALKKRCPEKSPCIGGICRTEWSRQNYLVSRFFVSEKLFVTERPRGIAKRRRLQRV